MTANRKNFFGIQNKQKNSVGITGWFYSKRRMNTNLANFIVGLLIDENDHFYFVQRIVKLMPLLRKRPAPSRGYSQGFAYTDGSKNSA